MAFQDELLETLVGVVGEEKKEELGEKVKPVLDKIGEVLGRSAKDIEDMKKRYRELEARQKTGLESPDSEEYRKVLRQLEERDQLVEQSKKSLGEVESKYQMTAKQAKELEKLNKQLQEKLAKETSTLDETLKTSELRKSISLLSFKDPSMADEVFKLLYSGVKTVTDENGSRKVFATTKGEGGADVAITLDDYVKEFQEKNPLSKSILAAPRSSGSGASGMGGMGSLGGPKTTEQMYQEAVASGNLQMQMALKARLAAEAK